MKKLINGNILVKFDGDLLTETDSGFRIAADYDREFNQCVTGTVMQVCEEKHINRDWHPKIAVDCQVGDRVIMQYMGCQTALECGLNNRFNGTWFIKDGEFYAVINYAFVMAIKRDGILKAAPGYVLARRVKKDSQTEGWVKLLTDDNDNIKFQLVAIGEDIVSRPGTFPAKGVSEGDVVLTDYNCEYELEQPHKMYILDEPLVCFEKHLIYGIL